MRRSPRLEQAEALLLHVQVHVQVHVHVHVHVHVVSSLDHILSTVQGCSLDHIWLQPLPHRVAGRHVSSRRKRSSLLLVCGCHTNVLRAADTPG